MVGKAPIACLALGLAAVCCAGAAPEITLEIRDYATLPMTGAVDGTGQIMGLLARVNFMREEPGGKKRLFVNDLNGPLYIYDRETGKFSTYLDFNGGSGHTGLFHKLPTDNGFANGFISFAFDPDYAHNGKFYTIHLEDPGISRRGDAGQYEFPGLESFRLHLDATDPDARPYGARSSRSWNGPTRTRPMRPSKGPRAN